MSETRKSGFFDRLFGRGPEPAEPPRPATAEEGLPAPASAPEGIPDFTTAAAAGQLPPVAPSATEASPDRAPDETPPDELSGADLQPIEGAPEGGGPREPIPRARPETAEEAPQPGRVPEARPGASAHSPAADPPRSWWRRLAEGMRRTSSALGDNVTSLFARRALDATTLEELEDALVRADLGLDAATRIADAVGKGRYDREIAPDAVRGILADEVERALREVARPLAIDRSRKPFVILVIGVNGAGKTTTIGKLAQRYGAEGLKVMIAAGDTFRAAAIEQLKIWGDRTGAPVIAREQGSDAAGLAFDALREARDRGADLLLVDTAGRLQNKAGLMAELEKIVRVMKKLDADAPHATLLVLDATIGQNALSQVELFRQVAGVTGLVMTKLDGTARGGILVALADRFRLPVHFIGVGEGVEDLQPFAARDFARALAGLSEAA